MLKQFVVATALASFSSSASADLQRTVFTARSEAGIEIAIRQVIAGDHRDNRDPVVLLHGARVPGIPSFDLDVPGGSLAGDLAESGHSVYIVDLRGYGGSTRPEAMSRPPRPSAPLVRSNMAVRDIDTAVNAILRRTEAEEVVILGWATGGHWAGMYATLQPDKVSKVIFYNTLYGYSPEHPTIGRGSRLAASGHPERFNIEAVKNYRLNDAASLLPSWNRSIPVENKDEWRDPAVAEAYVKAALASDVTSQDREPPSFRAPSGPMADSFLLATGAALWDARLLQADVLIIRSANDFWSRPEDVVMLKRHLEQRLSGTVSVVEIPNATHYVHLDRAERGRERFLQSVIDFLAEREG